MKLMIPMRFSFLVLLAVVCFLQPVAAQSALLSPSSETEVTLEGVAPDQVDSVLAKLSDEQVRSLLITELERDVPSQSSTSETPSGFLVFVVNWLHMIDSDTLLDKESRVQRVFDHIFKVPADLAGIVRQFGDGTSMKSALKNIGLALFVLLAALVVELLFRGVTAGFRRQFLEQGRSRYGRADAFLGRYNAYSALIDVSACFWGSISPVVHADPCQCSTSSPPPFYGNVICYSFFPCCYVVLAAFLLSKAGFTQITCH